MVLKQFAIEYEAINVERFGTGICTLFRMMNYRGSPLVKPFAFYVALSLALLSSCNQGSKFSVFDSVLTENLQPSQAELLRDYQQGKIKIPVPAGNLNPKLSWETLFEHLPPSTQERFAAFRNQPEALRAQLDARLQKPFVSLAKDPLVILELKKAANLYKITPEAILANIAGEHTFNVSLTDSVQDLVATASIWAGRWALRFESGGIKLKDWLQEPEVRQSCERYWQSSHADYWDCVGFVWEKSFRGKTVRGVTYENKGFKWTFFNPMGAGMTYGLGQMDPVRLLMVVDRVQKTSGFAPVTIDEPKWVYEALLNPRKVVHYIAANVVLAIEAYYNIAHFDISGNPGLTATLYNVGKEKFYARRKYEENIQSLRQGGSWVYPQETYYGFYVNERLNVLKRFLALEPHQYQEVTRGRLSLQP